MRRLVEIILFGSGNRLDESRLREHIVRTYNRLRVGMAVIALVFPFWLLLVGKWYYELELQGSMSAYYWASIEGDPPMRVWFVGFIFAIGSCLWLYKGYTTGENWALNLAGASVILVALFPMSWKCGSEHGYCAIWKWHAVFAFFFFACIMYVAFFQSHKTLPHLNDDQKVFGVSYKIVFRVLYLILGGLLVLLPAAATFAHIYLRRDETLIYRLELFSIVPFTVFWLIKSLELRMSQAGTKVSQEARTADEMGSIPSNCGGRET